VNLCFTQGRSEFSSTFPSNGQRNAPNLTIIMCVLSFPSFAICQHDLNVDALVGMKIMSSIYLLKVWNLSFRVKDLVVEYLVSNKDKTTKIFPHGYLMWRVNWFHLLNWTFEMCIDNILLPLSIYDIRFNYVHLVVLVSLLSISHEHIPTLKMHCNYVKSDSNIYISKLIINITHFLNSLTTYPFWDGRSSDK